jgi:hypothetical protein
MPAKLQAAARALLPASEIRAINANGLDLLAAAERTRLLNSVTGPMRQALEIESDLRYQFSRADVTYEEVERIAVLSGARPEDTRNAIRRGRPADDIHHRRPAGVGAGRRCGGAVERRSDAGRFGALAARPERSPAATA